MQKYGELTIAESYLNKIKKQKGQTIIASDLFSKITEEIFKSEFALNGEV